MQYVINPNKKVSTISNKGLWLIYLKFFKIKVWINPIKIPVSILIVVIVKNSPTNEKKVFNVKFNFEFSKILGIEVYNITDTASFTRPSPNKIL